MRLNVVPGMDTRRHAFKRNWTTYSKYDNHSKPIVNRIGGGDHLMSTRIVSLMMNELGTMQGKWLHPCFGFA